MSALTYQDVLDILRIIDSGSFSDFQIEFEGTKVKVTRQAGTTPAGAAPGTAPARSATHQAEAASTPHGAAPRVASPSGVGSESPSQRLPAEIQNGVHVKPPMAGTYYSAPSPGAAPFVEIDRTVKKGDQLGIVEVMKLFTPVLSPCDGTVRAILVGNEEFVQSDQTLIIIEASQ